VTLTKVSLIFNSDNYLSFRKCTFSEVSDFCEGTQSTLTPPSPAKQQSLTPTKRRRTIDYWALKKAARDNNSNKDETTVCIKQETEEEVDAKDDRVLIKDLAVGF